MSDSDEEIVDEKRYVEQGDSNLHPLFWDSMPTDAESNPLYEALKAIDDELSPEEKANSLKNNGNNKLKLAISDKADSLARRNLLRDAIKFYSDGFAINCGDDKLNSVLLSNRAQAHSLLGNWRNSFEDSNRSIKLDTSNVKSYFRGARAAQKLKRFSDARNICIEGLKIDSSNVELKKILKESEASIATATAAAAREKAALDAKERPFRELSETLLVKRGYKFTSPVASHLGRKILTEEDGSLTFPAVFFIPEARQEDVVERLNENDTFDDHLDLMFGDNVPPLEWDEEREYKRKNLELYYLSNSGETLNQAQVTTLLQGKMPDLATADAMPKKFGDKAARYVKVDTRRTVREVLSEAGHIIPLVPFFFVLAKNTSYR
eukprot:CAMPEP_0175073596 /NCGR_PEP_ID=MMETSP0052_2-20121109/20691_1 /TAXON_ID=51329 ORGANISM="Polytomella parva, Strain SAG 63-3" /NCGR_SAMPLE_ID=MMETSP0052_2 /ASSEMBLY_ACC=CAM_ASM_000194 /LENGTH=378 /DNA_ID=CAMNT_0016341505 /DNA_START=14 /DNA_END=1146 /DNA_ORIENTATION=+